MGQPSGPIGKENNPRLRFCPNYRRLNFVTVRDSYPKPRMDDCIDSLGDPSVITTLDGDSGYWQIPVQEEKKDNTTSTCHSGLYRLTRMPFGLRNTPFTFQRALDTMLSKAKWTTSLVHIDDVIV